MLSKIPGLGKLMETVGIKQSGKLTENIIAGYRGDVNHIINGSRGTSSGHAWEVLFNGSKPSWDNIKPYIADAIEKGNITKEVNLPDGGKVIYRSLAVNGYEVWTKEFVKNGVRKLSDAGVNNW